MWPAEIAGSQATIAMLHSKASTLTHFTGSFWQLRRGGGKELLAPLVGVLPSLLPGDVGRMC